LNVRDEFQGAFLPQPRAASRAEFANRRRLARREHAIQLADFCRLVTRLGSIPARRTGIERHRTWRRRGIFPPDPVRNSSPPANDPRATTWPKRRLDDPRSIIRSTGRGNPFTFFRSRLSPRASGEVQKNFVLQQRSRRDIFRLRRTSRQIINSRRIAWFGDRASRSANLEPLHFRIESIKFGIGK